ncbi:unnamed protein product [Echinostoma caproni]|uniref:Uncharacterized protein n=1 Tax=Echinostoma caproni TaxID=27848 RepID=A0A183BDP3_9TREM|nr:unnamed protein product [Echinostoma caproni]
MLCIACGLRPSVITSLYRSVASNPRLLFHTTSLSRKKEIRCTVEKNVTTIEGVIVPSERAEHVIRLDGLGDPRDTDPISRAELDIQPTDVRILAQFLRPDGTILPRSVTGISLRSQLHIELQIERARKAVKFGLLGNNALLPGYRSLAILIDFDDSLLHASLDSFSL